MVRAPCCWMKGLKKGPWTAEEDDILRSFIEKHGHDNWRALPKKAGLLRCGKSCRLRWTNYLRPDVKRGNFTKEEEGTIIRLHASLGNKWSVIAAQLPGRTDNEIKNTWHTRLKKLVLESDEPRPDGSAISISTQEESQYQENSNMGSPHPLGFEVDISNTAQVQSISGSSPLGFEVEYSSTAQVQDNPIFSPQPSYDGISSVYTGVDNDNIVGFARSDISFIKSLVPFSEPDESFWPDSVSSEHINNPVQPEMDSWGEDMLQFPKEVVSNSIPTGNYDPVGLWHNEKLDNVVSNDGLDFWYDLFVQSGGFEQLSEFYFHLGQD